jgi:hypothetical protein
VYLPEEWSYNRAQFQAKGHTIDDPGLVRFLQPLPPEGFYRVLEAFHCCEKQCRLFEQDALLQLGYNADADPILFTPELVDSMLAIPAKGWKTTLETLGKVRQLHDRELAHFSLLSPTAYTDHLKLKWGGLGNMCAGFQAPARSKAGRSIAG